MTALLGINVDRTISLTFMLGAALAAVAGVMVPFAGGGRFHIGFVAGIKAFLRRRAGRRRVAPRRCRPF